MNAFECTPIQIVEQDVYRDDRCCPNEYIGCGRD